VDAEQLLLLGLGAAGGAVGWLVVDLYINRREAVRRARNAGRAVYFELSANQLVVFTALQYGSFGHLSRGTFDRLLPELATWLPAAELQAVALAYLGHDGYEQVRTDGSVPEEVRRVVLSGVNDGQILALELLRSRIFSTRELSDLHRHTTNWQRALIEAAAKDRIS
jgi:hypothetical protein